MHKWPQHIQEEIVARTTDDWEAVDAVTIWDDDTEHRVNTAMQSAHDTHLDIKIHRDRLTGSALPVDMTGCECLVSDGVASVRDPGADASPNETTYATISNQRTSGNHVIITLPTHGPVAYTP